MTLGISPTARAGWSALANRDFLAVLDLMTLVEEARTSGYWGHVDVVAEYERPYGTHKVVVRDRITSVMDLTGWELISVGRPT